MVHSRGHLDGALDKFALWNLHALAADLPALRTPLHLLVGEQDGTVPPAAARRAQALVPAATLTTLAGLGHLAHEEDAPRVAAALRSALASQ